VTSRIWLSALAIALIAALAVALTYLVATWAFGAALGMSWGDANLRARLANDAAQIAETMKRRHQSEAQIAHAVVDMIRSTHSYDAAVVSDSGALLAGSSSLAAHAVPPFFPPRMYDERPAIGARPPAMPGPPSTRPGPSGAPQFNIAFGPRAMPFIWGRIPGGPRPPWGVELFAFQRPGLGDPEYWHFPVSIVAIDGASILITRSPDPLNDIVTRLRWFAIGVGIVAFGLTLLVAQRSLRSATRPVELVRSALSRLGRGDYSRLSGADPDDAVAREVIDAYNAAAEELSASAAQRAEVEANARRFVADAGHELRTPLAVITGYVDLLRQSSSEDDVMERRIFAEIQGQGERMRALIANLLFLMRLDSQEPVDVKILDAADIVRSVIGSFQTLAGGAELNVEGTGGAFVQISENELRQAVGNLVDNALKYAPGATITAGVRNEGDHVVVTVADDGPGMSPDVRSRAFERFARGETSGSVPGSGLGLAIVARTVERARGTIALRTEPGKGVTVEMRFPAWLAVDQRSPRSE
jgi:two-component system, OmpR family, sensor kinase